LKDIERLLERCEEIIEKGEEAFNDEEALRTQQYGKIFSVFASIEDIYHLIFPDKIPFHLTTTHFDNFLKSSGIYTTHHKPHYFFNLRFEKFKAFTEDLKQGLITDISNVITLDLFDDLLEQASELRTHNTEPLNRAACVLTRIVLEDTLKKLCDNNNLHLKTDKASEANDELKKALIYPKPQWRIIQGWLDIGNEAAHPTGNFQSIIEAQMDDMIKGVKEFSLKYLS
jgi:hypothetical protein